MSSHRDLSVSIISSLVIASIGYSIQFIVFQNWFASQSVLINYLFRTARMLVGYIIPAIYYLHKQGLPRRTLGFQIISARVFVLSFFFGILLYIVPSYVFVKYDIFTTSWGRRDWGTTLSYFVLIATMAGITDLWTRGFVLLQVERIRDVYSAIILQNLIWFVIHIYEIIALMSYIGLGSAIALTLFLGIGGDLIVLKTKNVVGLMVGHGVLNLAIILQGKGIINF